MTIMVHIPESAHSNKLAAKGSKPPAARSCDRVVRSQVDAVEKMCKSIDFFPKYL